MDPATISTGLSSLKAAYEIAKYLKESDLSLEKAETKNKLADLLSALAEVKMQLADVRVLLIDKDEEIKRLKEELTVKGNLVYEKPYYWLEVEDGRKGPYCPACYDDKQKLSTLIDGPKGHWTCCVCRKVFLDDNYERPKRIKINSGFV